MTRQRDAVPGEPIGSPGKCHGSFAYALCNLLQIQWLQQINSSAPPAPIALKNRDLCACLELETDIEAARPLEKYTVSSLYSMPFLM